MISLRDHVIRSVKTWGVRVFPKVARVVEDRYGVHLVRRHYYSPVPDAADMGPGFWDEISEMSGVDMGLDRGLSFVRDVVPQHIEGFRQRFPLHQTQGEDFFLINGTYMAVDAHVYWCLIRHYRPRRIIEIGAHASTMVSVAAITSLKAETGHETKITAIEPYPSDYLRREHGKSITLMESKVQDVPLSVFEELGDGDILFIDSTHVLREGSDVQYEYLELLPRLRPGVFVHVHDVSLPRRYPKVYFDNRTYWNEQYLLQAFLAFNSCFEVVWAGNAMMLAHPDAMMSAFPEIAEMRAVYPSSEPTAFWMRVRSKQRQEG